MSDEDDLLAAEVALGLVDGAEVAARGAGDREFAARITWWEERFAGLAAPLDAEPPPQLWSRIAARLPANDDPAHLWRWKLATGALASAVAVALVMLAQRPPGRTPVSSAAPVVASLSGETGSTLAISYDKGSQRLTIAPIVLDPGRGDAELWVIPAGTRRAVSLGVFDARRPSSHQLDPAHARLVGAGATLAVSLEQRGGSPTGQHLGPIVATGTLVST